MQLYKNEEILKQIYFSIKLLLITYIANIYYYNILHILLTHNSKQQSSFYF